MASLAASLRQRISRLGLFSTSRPAPGPVRAAAQPGAAAALSTSPVLANYGGVVKSAKKKKQEQNQLDPRIKVIRYHRDHNALKIVPRPLGFSRLRALRHWTITRAWRLYTLQKRENRQAELQKLSESMWEACEELRLMDGHGRRIGVDVPSTPELDEGIARAEERENAALSAAAAASTAGRGSNTEMELKAAAVQKAFEVEDGALPLDRQIGKLYRKAMSKKGVWRGFPIEAARIQTDFPPAQGWNKDWERA